MKQLLKGLVLILISFGLGIIISPRLFPQYSQNSLKETRKSYNFKYINPLLECDATNISDNKNLNSLKKEIQFIIDQQIDNHQISFASVYYRDLNNGPWIGINASEYFSPASLIKVPLMIVLLKEAEENPSILTKEILNSTDFDYTQQNITPTQILEKDKSYTVEDLIERMIVYSDNAAYELLLENIDNAKVFKVYKDLDVDISKAQEDPNGNIVTVKDYASFFRILYNSSYLNDNMSEKALSILSKTQYNKGLADGIPEEINVAHKFGERQFTDTKEKQLHDCGIVYAPQKPYLICVMTRGQDFNKLSNFIKQISQTVYTNITKPEN